MKQKEKPSFAERWAKMTEAEKRQWYTDILHKVVRAGKNNNNGSSFVKEIADNCEYTYPMVRYILHGKVKRLRDYHFHIMAEADKYLSL